MDTDTDYTSHDPLHVPDEVPPHSHSSKVHPIYTLFLSASVKSTHLLLNFVKQWFANFV